MTLDEWYAEVVKQFTPGEGLTPEDFGLEKEDFEEVYLAGKSPEEGATLAIRTLLGMQGILPY